MQWENWRVLLRTAMSTIIFRTWITRPLRVRSELYTREATSNRTRHFWRKFALHPKNSRNGYKNNATLQKEKWTLYTCFLFKEKTQQTFLPQETQIRQCMVPNNTYITGPEINMFFFYFACVIIDSCRVNRDNALVSGRGTAWSE
jgi:hypothetical protein